MTNPIISVRQLQKTISRKEILSSISFEIEKGDCVALIGPNGAGKTTLMRCLLGDKKASSGTVLINGSAAKPKGKVAVLLQENQVPTGLKVKELIDFFRNIADNPLSLSEIRSFLQFDDQQLQQFSQKLSGGQKRLLSFVLCLIAQPDILFLDEPTAGMDTSTRQRFWELVGHLKKRGTTILYSSHYIEEVEHTAERILVLHKGKLLRDTTPFAMRASQREKQVTLPITYQEKVSHLGQVYDVRYNHDTVSFMTKDLAQVWQTLQQQGCHITDIEIQNKSLLDSLFDTTKEDEK